MHGGSATEERAVPFVWVPCRGDAAQELAAWPANQLEIRRFVVERMGSAR